LIRATAWFATADERERNEHDRDAHQLAPASGGWQ
jgi:hypothetical protein